jgi:membrane-associated protein
VGDAIRSLGVWAILVFAAFDSVGLPASGDAAVVLGAATRDEPLAVIVLLGFAGALIGDQVVYWAGRLAGRVVVPRLVGADRQRRVEAALDRRAAVTLVGGRLVTAIRSEVAFLAGAVRLPYARFALWNAVGCLVWAVLAALAGRLLARAVDVEPLLETAERWSARVGIAVVVGVAGVVSWRVVRARRNPQRDPSPHG